MHVDFFASAERTLGVEWEIGLIDETTCDLVSCAREVLDEVHAQHGHVRGRVTGELLLNTVELVTGICRTAGEARDDLADSLEAVRTVTDPLGVGLFSAGTHPFAQWSDQRVSSGERYAKLIDRTQWWGRQMLIFGLHVHIGVTHREKVLPLLNGMLAYHPHLQALSASSPFWGGVDTGYASNRALMFQQLPTAGLPFTFDRWGEFEAFVDDLHTTGVIDDVSELRWDLRPSPRLGTLEVRVSDSVPSLLEVGALAALTHCLALDLDHRLEAGEDLPVLAPWHVQENKWRAARYGLEAIIILDAGSMARAGGPVRESDVTTELHELLNRLEPLAHKIGCADQLRDVELMIQAGASYQRQRGVAQRHSGDLAAVVRHLAEEMRVGHPLV